jgi:N-acyl-D-aspartate/D-glutamate deacylase
MTHTYLELGNKPLTFVAGEATYRDGVETGALPGRLLRGPRPAQQPTNRVAA